MKLSSRHCTHFFHMISVYQGFGNMNEKSKMSKSILSGKSICVHFNFRVNPVVMIPPLAGRTLLMAECKKVPTVRRNKELTLSEQLAMLTHHAGPLKSTLHDCNCSSCLTLYLYLYSYSHLYLYLYFSSSGRACRAGSGCIHPTYFVPNSSLPQTLPFFLSASSFSAITSSTSLFKILHLTFQFWWNMLFCYFLAELSLFNINYLV